METYDLTMGNLDEGVIEEILVSLPLAENTEDFYQFISAISEDDTVANPLLHTPFLDEAGRSIKILSSDLMLNIQIIFFRFR